MNKYGTENFVVEQLCDNNELSSYEIQYIEKYNTYSSGYNATKGGDGSILFDYKLILDLYKGGTSMREVAAKVGCSVNTVSKVIHINDVPLNKIIAGTCRNPVKVKQFDLEGNFIREWSSIADAAHWLVDNGYAKNIMEGLDKRFPCAVKENSI